MNRSSTTVNGSERQAKFVQDRINQVEKYFGFLCQTFGSITRKNARLRDKSDILTTHVLSYADNESINHSTRKCLLEFAGNYGTVQDYRQAQVERLEAKVVKPLSNYGNVFKKLKADLKRAIASRKKEMKQQKSLQTAKEKNTGNPNLISQAENALQHASEDASRSSKELEDSMNRFEKNKITDLKKVLSDYVKIEMSFHSKALEYLTKCSQNLEAIDEDEDLTEFKNSLREFRGVPSILPRQGEMSNQLGVSSSVNQRPGNTLTSTAREQTLTSSGMYSTDGIDDDDDDDDLSDDDDDGYEYRR